MKGILSNSSNQNGLDKYDIFGTIIVLVLLCVCRSVKQLVVRRTFYLIFKDR